MCALCVCAIHKYAHMWSVVYFGKYLSVSVCVCALLFVHFFSFLFRFFSFCKIRLFFSVFTVCDLLIIAGMLGKSSCCGKNHESLRRWKPNHNEKKMIQQFGLDAWRWFNLIRCVCSICLNWVFFLATIFRLFETKWMWFEMVSIDSMVYDAILLRQNEMNFMSWNEIIHIY